LIGLLQVVPYFIQCQAIILTPILLIFSNLA
jgi:hypothetical protein